MVEKPRCDKCGAFVKQGDTRCVRCSTEEVDGNFCKECGADIPFEDDLCPKCRDGRSDVDPSGDSDDGAVEDQPPAEPMEPTKCEVCGNPVDAGQTFCERHGRAYIEVVEKSTRFGCGTVLIVGPPTTDGSLRFRTQPFQTMELAGHRSEIGA